MGWWECCNVGPREFNDGEMLEDHLMLGDLKYPVTISMIKSIHPCSDEIS